MFTELPCNMCFRFGGIICQQKEIVDNHTYLCVVASVKKYEKQKRNKNHAKYFLMCETLGVSQIINFQIPNYSSLKENTVDVISFSPSLIIYYTLDVGFLIIFHVSLFLPSSCCYFNIFVVYGCFSFSLNSLYAAPAIGLSSDTTNPLTLFCSLSIVQYQSWGSDNSQSVPFYDFWCVCNYSLYSQPGPMFCFHTLLLEG